MNIKTMRLVDRFAGVPLCALLSRLKFLFPAQKNSSPRKRFLFIELSEMGSTILGYASFMALKEKYPDAESAYENALKLNANSYQAWHQLGKVYATDLKFDKAVGAYGKVVELNPKFAEAYQGFGSSYYWNGDKGKALEQVQKLRELKLGSRANELDNWIKDKEEKRGKAAQKAGGASQAPPAVTTGQSYK